MILTAKVARVAKVRKFNHRLSQTFYLIEDNSGRWFDLGNICENLWLIDFT
jgi:hypothetical protein